MGLGLRLVLLVVTLLSIGMQLRTVVRVGAAGLSPATWLGLMTSTMFWFGYGVATGEMTLVTINIPVMLMALALVSVMVSQQVTTVRRAAPYVLIPLAGWLLAWATGSAAILGWGGTVLVVGRLLPQLVEAVRAEDRSGISPGAWIGNGSNKVVWAVYGFSIQDTFVAWPSAAAAVVSFVVVLLVMRPQGPTRRRRVVSLGTTRTRGGFAISADHAAARVG